MSTLEEARMKARAAMAERKRNQVQAKANTGATGSLLPLPLRKLVEEHPKLRRPVIHGLIRSGETMNIIANPKAGKSWLATDVALSLCTGRRWLDSFDVETGMVLMVDNELHAETLANRIPKVAEARSLASEEYQDRIDVLSLRGRLRSLDRMDDIFGVIEKGKYVAIILDAFYRFLPDQVSENDNAQMARLYNLLDGHAQKLESSFLLVHHASKGNQSERKVTDVGAGAGSQSRAADAHLIIREHQEKNCFVIDASVRSWAPVSPICVRWEWPVFTREPDLNPQDLLQTSRGRVSGALGGDRVVSDRPEWDPQWVKKQVERYGEPGCGKQTLIDLIRRATDMNDHKAKQLIRMTEEQRLIQYRQEGGRNRPGHWVATSEVKLFESLEGEATEVVGEKQA